MDSQQLLTAELGAGRSGVDFGPVQNVIADLYPRRPCETCRSPDLAVHCEKVCCCRTQFPTPHTTRFWSSSNPFIGILIFVTAAANFSGQNCAGCVIGSGARSATGLSASGLSRSLIRPSRRVSAKARRTPLEKRSSSLQNLGGNA